MEGTTADVKFRNWGLPISIVGEQVGCLASSAINDVVARCYSKGVYAKHVHQVSDIC